MKTFEDAIRILVVTTDNTDNTHAVESENLTNVIEEIKSNPLTCTFIECVVKLHLSHLNTADFYGSLCGMCASAFASGVGVGQEMEKGSLSDEQG